MSTTLLILLIFSSKSNSIVPRSRDNWPRSTEFVGFIEISKPILCLRTPGFFFFLTFLVGRATCVFFVVVDV